MSQVAVEKMHDTAEERKAKEEEITSASAATLVKKMSNGQCGYETEVIMDAEMFC